MKITIEIDDKELKDLIFGEDRNIKHPLLDGWIVRFNSKQEAHVLLGSLKIVAAEHGYASTRDCKDLIYDMCGKLRFIGFYDINCEKTGYGWTLHYLCKYATVCEDDNKTYYLLLPKPTDVY